MGQAYDIPQAPHGLPPAVPGAGPAAGKPIKEFVDGVPVDPTTGRPMAQPPVATDKPVWTEQLQMPEQTGSGPALVSPVPAQTAPRTISHTSHELLAIKREGVDTSAITGEPIYESLLPAMPVAPALPAEASGKCITEGCKSKTKDRGMCAKCLKDTMEYMKKDPKITWEFLEANGLALPSSSARSGNKFLAGLTAKLAKLHATPDGPKQA